jgi:uncharacterized DUF497 family protein
MDIEWDSAKDLSNQKKHGISFSEASELFAVEDYLEIYDEKNSISEDRFISIGPIQRGIALVVWTERFENKIRFISARMATKNEITMYQNRLGQIK